MLIALVAAAPSLALRTYFYLRDRYEREPIGHVTATYLLGALAMLGAWAVETWLASWEPLRWPSERGEAARSFDAFVLTDSIEEFAKWAARWTELAQTGTEVAYIEDDRGEGLMGNIRRASRVKADPPAVAPAEAPVGNQAGRLSEQQPAGRFRRSSVAISWQCEAAT
jgi:hypothetical protein